MGTDRCDKIISIIDLALDGPNVNSTDGRICWYCNHIAHNQGPSGLCDNCLTILRDPDLSIGPPNNHPSDAERPALLEGTYDHRVHTGRLP